MNSRQAFFGLHLGDLIPWGLIFAISINRKTSLGKFSILMETFFGSHHHNIQGQRLSSVNYKNRQGSHVGSLYSSSQMKCWKDIM